MGGELLTVEELRKYLRVDTETGKLYWMPIDPSKRGGRPDEYRRWRRGAADEAFTSLCKGYRRGKIKNRDYAAHRVVFALVHGRWPVANIDHINGVRHDNRPCNLREASYSENNQNVGPRGSSRFIGVSWDKSAKKWRVIGMDSSGRQTWIGFFRDETEAARAYDAFILKQDRPFARLNFHHASTTASAQEIK